MTEHVVLLPEDPDPLPDPDPDPEDPLPLEPDDPEEPDEPLEELDDPDELPEDPEDPVQVTPPVEPELAQEHTAKAADCNRAISEDVQFSTTHGVTSVVRAATFAAVH